MYSRRPSGDSTIASGRLPTWTCRPAGAIFQPFGSSVTPPPSGPGRSDAGTSPYDEASAAQSVTSTNERPQRDRLVCVIGINGLVFPDPVQPRLRLDA